MPIKLIIFDFNGVTVHGGYPELMAHWAKRYQIDAKTLYRQFYTKYLNLVALQKISTRDAWEKPLRSFGIPLTWREAIGELVGVSRLNAPVCRLSDRLRRNYTTVVVSKNVREHWSRYRREFHFERYFDQVINLQDYRLPKSGPATVRFLCRRFRVKSNEIVIIDDQRDNLTMAKRLGVRTVFYTSYPALIRDLKEFGVSPV
jgi:FMN phosphatase YigB (HAD superfamily)